jgi:hypothetical protein
MILPIIDANVSGNPFTLANPKLAVSEAWLSNTEKKVIPKNKNG